MWIFIEENFDSVPNRIEGRKKRYINTVSRIEQIKNN